MYNCHLCRFIVCEPTSVTETTVLLLLSCQENDYSLVDWLGFIDSQHYRYRTINKYMNCKDVNKWSMDIVAIIPSFVESKKGLFRVTAI